MIDTGIILRIILAFGVIAGLLGGFAFAVRKLRGRLPVLGNRCLRVVESALLTNGSAVHVVRAGDKTLVVASATGGVTLLCTLDLPYAQSVPRGSDNHAA